MADEVVTSASRTQIGAGLLGATADGEYAAQLIKGERLLMIERRILRIEMALRQSGIEVEHFPLPK